MKGTRIIGIILIVLGVLGFILGGISFTTKEEVADLGPLEIQKEKKTSIPITPIASGAALIGGIVLVLAGSRKS